MSNRALELYEQSRPLESLESFIFRVAERTYREESGMLKLRSVETHEGALEFHYRVVERTPFALQEAGALSGFAVAAVMTVRALLTRRTPHVLGAIQAASVALAFGGREVPRLLRRARRRAEGDAVLLRLRGSQLCFQVGAEEVHVDLAPVSGLTVRTFRFHWTTPRLVLHFAQVEMQDGRLLTVAETEDSVEVRRMVHQIAKSLPVELSFQNIDLYKGQNRFSWELGPRLVEPALN